MKKVVKTKWCYRQYEETQKGEKLSFIRFELPWFGIGCHLQYGNYLKGRGWEVFTISYRRCWRIFTPFVNWQFGWTNEPYRRKFFRARWFGTGSQPFRTWVIRIGRLGFGSSYVPKWISRIAQRQLNRYWERYIEEYERQCEACGWDLEAGFPQG